MKNLVVFLTALAFVVACGSGATSTAAKSPAPPGPITKYKNSLSGLNAGAQVDLIQNVIDFAPGAASIVHMHTTPNLATIIAGQITVKTPAGDKQAGLGQMLIEPINVPLQAVNAGSGEATVVVAFVVPHGGKATSGVAGQAAPALLNKTLSSFTLSAPTLTGPYSLVQQVQSFAPGAQTPQHRHGGPGLITVLQGQVTLNRDGVFSVYGAGESFVESPGQTLQAFNHGTSDLVVAATFLLPDGAQLTTNV